jgi:hypothetical protein
VTEVIDGALWAAAAGSVIAALLATIVGTFIRLRRPAASSRCTLWLIAFDVPYCARRSSRRDEPPECAIFRSRG